MVRTTPTVRRSNASQRKTSKKGVKLSLSLDNRKVSRRISSEVARVVEVIRELEAVVQNTLQYRLSCKFLCDRCLEFVPILERGNDLPAEALSSIEDLVRSLINFASSFMERFSVLSSMESALGTTEQRFESFLKQIRDLKSKELCGGADASRGESIEIGRLRQALNQDQQAWSRCFRKLISFNASSPQEEANMLTIFDNFSKKEGVSRASCVPLESVLLKFESIRLAVKDQSTEAQHASLEDLKSLVVRMDISMLLQNELIGSGGFGNVYKGVYNGSDVAVKRFRRGATSFSEKEFRMILREILLAQKLNHKNIIQFLGASIGDQENLLVLELAEISLYALLHRDEGKQYIGLLDKLKTIHELSEGLAYLHFHGIIHRDMKSLNILFVRQKAEDDPTGGTLIAKIADFGLSTSSSLQTALKSSTGGGGFVGTVWYLAPELFQTSGESTSPKHTFYSDLYSFGVVINEILSEKLPWGVHADYLVIANLLRGLRPVLHTPAGGDSTESMIENRLMEIVGDKTKGCFCDTPGERPTAEEIAETTKMLLEVKRRGKKRRQVVRIHSTQSQSQSQSESSS